jgi:hypothetical protein
MELKNQNYSSFIRTTIIIPVVMMDIKGDFSGIAKEGEEKSFITERHAKINLPYNVAKSVELHYPNKKRVRLRRFEFDRYYFREF